MSSTTAPGTKTRKSLVVRSVFWWGIWMAGLITFASFARLFDGFAWQWLLKALFGGILSASLFIFRSNWKDNERMFPVTKLGLLAGYAFIVYFLIDSIWLYKSPIDSALLDGVLLVLMFGWAPIIAIVAVQHQRKLQPFTEDVGWEDMRNIAPGPIENLRGPGFTGAPHQFPNPDDDDYNSADHEPLDWDDDDSDDDPPPTKPFGVIKGGKED